MTQLKKPANKPHPPPKLPTLPVFTALAAGSYGADSLGLQPVTALEAVRKSSSGPLPS
jgi:hypothetical protein